MFTAIYSDSIRLFLITEENAENVRELFSAFPDAAEMQAEFDESYRPRFEDEKLVKYAFYMMLGDELAGLTLLDIDDWETRTASTGADVLVHMRGRGIAPRSKPHLFYLAFEILNLNRVETGCFVSNFASKKSIEKTQGFQYEGTKRQSGVNDHGALEDEHFYAILREDWERIYDRNRIELFY